jgi:muconolactone delta-isomerase
VTALHAAEFAIFTADEREQLINLLARFAAHLMTLDLDSVTAAAKPRKALRNTTRRLRKGAPHD